MQQSFLKPKSGKGLSGPALSARRLFLQKAGLATASAAVLLSGCQPEFVEVSEKAADARSARRHSTAVDLGSGDVAVLNYAYLLEQLEAAFYTTAVANQVFMNRLTTRDRQFFADIRNHEVAHRDFFKAALGSNAIPEVEFDFSAIYFGNRKQVLETAKTFEDLGVAAYNGAGRLLENKEYLLLAGKIVSVEARHAAYLREVIGYYDPTYADPTLFAGEDIIDENGLDLALPPAQVLAAAAPFIKADITFDAFA
jgi:hypothetical protein